MTRLIFWSHDSSALALRNGYSGWTTELFRADSIAAADHSKLHAGDLAVTDDGIHVMAYLGSYTWIEADPDAHKVIEVGLPTDNQWFRTPVVFVRWRWFDPPKAPNKSGSGNGAMALRPQIRCRWRAMPKHVPWAR